MVETKPIKIQQLIDRLNNVENKEQTFCLGIRGYERGFLRTEETEEDIFLDEEIT